MKLFALILLLVATGAMAQANHHNIINPTYNLGTSSISASQASAAATASATGGQGGTGIGGEGGAGGQGGQGGNSISTSSGGAGGPGGSAQSFGGANTNNNVSSVTHERSAFSAIAPGLAVGNGACMGSSSLGAQGVAFGLSLGSTWHDEACDRRYNAQMLDYLGKTSAAMVLMCQDRSVREAMEDAGEYCPPTRAQRTAAAAQSLPAPQQGGTPD